MDTAVKITEKSEDRLFNFRPVFFAAVFLCLGIAFGYLEVVEGVSPWWKCLLVTLFVPTAFYAEKKKRLRAFLAALLLLVVFFVGEGAFRMQIASYLESRYFDGEATIAGRVIEIRDYDYSIYVLLTDVSVDGKGVTGNFIAYLPASFGENVRLSDRIVVTAKIETYKTLFDEYGFAVNRIRDDIRYRLYAVQDGYVTGHTFDLFLSVRERILSVIQSGMDETPAAVTIALFLGDAGGVDATLLENIRYGGIAHIFAVSGLHVGALYLFCRKFFQKVSVPPLLSGLLLAAVLIFYAGGCGFSASVLRAVVICLLAHFANSAWLKTDFLQSLGAAAILVLLRSPTALYEVGFQLSFSACLGLALFSRPIQTWLEKAASGIENLVKRLLKWDRRARPRPREKNGEAPPTLYERARRSVLSFLAACIAAQLATAPIQYCAFGYLSGWSLALNCLFVPIVSGVFAVFLLLVAIACILPIAAANVLLYLPSVAWETLLLFFETVDLTAFALTGIAISEGAVLSYYFGLQFLSDKWNISQRQKTVLIVLSLLACAVCIFVGNV